VALAKVWEVVRSTSLPVIGVGGICTTQDALEFLIVGARAVQVGTASFWNPTAGWEIVEGLMRFLEDEGLTSVREIIGSYRSGS
jgi:dihydroorotate dehydrogenase (NAD+) catalytic subunit